MVWTRNLPSIRGKDGHLGHGSIATNSVFEEMPEKTPKVSDEPFYSAQGPQLPSIVEATGYARA